jgi:hypothetical protein
VNIKGDIILENDEILDFIRTRFSSDCNWTNGNCYYFAVILKERFGGVIMYDVVNGHFVTYIDGILYDWNGAVVWEDLSGYIEWEKFDAYDSLQKQRIIRDCIM